MKKETIDLKYSKYESSSRKRKRKPTATVSKPINDDPECMIVETVLPSKKRKILRKGIKIKETAQYDLLPNVPVRNKNKGKKILHDPDNRNSKFPSSTKKKKTIIKGNFPK